MKEQAQFLTNEVKMLKEQRKYAAGVMRGQACLKVKVALLRLLRAGRDFNTFARQ